MGLTTYGHNLGSLDNMYITGANFGSSELNQGIIGVHWVIIEVYLGTSNLIKDIIEVYWGPFFSELFVNKYFWDLIWYYWRLVLTSGHQRVSVEYYCC